MPKKNIVLFQKSQEFTHFVKWALQEDDWIIHIGKTPAQSKALLEDLPQIDLIIGDTDISEPFERFLQKSRQIHSDTPILILSEETLDKHVEWMSIHNIHHFFSKSTPFHTGELRKRILDILYCENNLSKLINPISEGEIRINSPEQIDPTAELLSQKYFPKNQANRVCASLVELLTNALFYGARKELSENRLQWIRDFTLAEHEELIITHGEDKTKVLINIKDPGGLLKNETALHWLNRQTKPNETSSPEGLLDTRGRGIFLARKMSDRLFFNIQKNTQSECFIINYKTKNHSPFKPWSFLTKD
ncbi:ATP-binding protein [bacterium]|nr:ATP-binding protein [bacterium]